MVIYVKDEDGIVHLADGSGCAEFTFCDREWGCGAGGGADMEISGSASDLMVGGPATCHKCKEQVDKIRNSLNGVKWKL